VLPRRPLLVLLAALPLAACGKKGGLELPPRPQEQAREEQP
jgi:predicted small lipoprotein YifL